MHKICADNYSMNIASLQLNSPVLLAPMAGISNLAYRRIMKEHGAALVFTEMVSCNGLIRDGRKTLELVRSCQEEAPLGIQLFGAEPEVVAKSVENLNDTGDLIDLNLGCPVNKVVRSGAGSALLKDPTKVSALLGALRRATPKPLTIKIRSGWDADSINFIEIGKIAEANGVDAITLHPRTRSQGFSGKADWSQLAQLKQALAIPVIGSGDIFSPEDALNMLRISGCDGIMIGRGGYGNPWLISNILRRLNGLTEISPSPKLKLEVALRHLDFHQQTLGIKKTMFEMRKHLCWYSRGLPGATQFRAEVNRTNSLDELRQTTRDFFDRAEENHGK